MRRKVITRLTLVFIACFVVWMFFIRKDDKYVWGNSVTKGTYVVKFK